MNIDFRNNISRQLYTHLSNKINPDPVTSGGAAVVSSQKTITKVALTALAWVGTFFLWITEKAVRHALSCAFFAPSIPFRIIIQLPCYLANRSNGSCEKVLKFFEMLDLYDGSIAGMYDTTKVFVDHAVAKRVLAGNESRDASHRKAIMEQIATLPGFESSKKYSRDFQKKLVDKLPANFLQLEQSAQIEAVNAAIAMSQVSGLNTGRQTAATVYATPQHDQGTPGVNPFASNSQGASV